jgi:hypothetical protein
MMAAEGDARAHSVAAGDAAAMVEIGKVSWLMRMGCELLMVLLWLVE